ncbi:MAG: hypothetical protein AB7O29_05240 [Acidimicrobiia bacterium]
MTTSSRRRSEPKGKPTPARNIDRDEIARANRRATLQWIVVFVVIALLLVALAAFGPSGDGPNAPIGGHGG